MKYIASVFCAIFALNVVAEPSKESTSKEIKTSVGLGKNSTVADNFSSQKIRLQEDASKTAENFVPSLVDLWGESAAGFDEIFKSEPQKKIFDMDKALEILRDKIICRHQDQRVDLDEVFVELRKIFTESQFSTEELMDLIEDALELKKKYVLIFDFVIRGEYARRAVQEGLNADEVLQVASSEYIQLPSFILRSRVNSDQLNDALTDLGCGIIWKDRIKYLFVLNKYFGKTGEKSSISENGLKNFPRRIRNYLKLLAEIDRFFGEAYEHLVYLIAQDFYYAEVPQRKILKIFSFSEKEWNSVIEPIKNRNL